MSRGGGCWRLREDPRDAARPPALDHSDPFDPRAALAAFSREFLAMLGREYLLMGHLVDRVGMPLVLQRFGDAAALEIGRRQWVGCAALAAHRLRRALALEDDAYSWFAGLSAEPHPALDAIAGAVNPRARCRAVAAPRGTALAWDVVIDPDAPPQEDPLELKLGRISRGAEFELMRRRPLRA